MFLKKYNIAILSGKKEATYSLHNKHMTEEWIYRLATHGNVLGPLQTLLGNNLILLDSRFICKYPVSEVDKEGFVAWHQDQR